ncbi:transketolase [bacterium]|nr:transketolase [bacterium]
MAAAGQQDIDRKCIDTIRTLAMDAVQAANSGHPGTPMALAPVAYELWQHHLRYDPTDPLWPGRDRFVLSNGHASMLLYALVFLAGVEAVGRDGRKLGKPSLTIEEIRRFRQLHSLTPGHPEHGHTTGVETTTGPLGQGLANSVGMAMAQAWLSSRYDRPGTEIFDYDVYAICGDGCMMEGISNEAASLAAHQHLSNLCWIYDDNHITIEGDTSLAFSESVPARFEGLGWNVLHVADANDTAAVGRAIEAFRACKDRPTLIVVRSHIAWGAPNKQDTAAAHGEPLGEEEIRLAKRAYGWPEDAKFLVPDGVPEHFRAVLGARGRSARVEWETRLVRFREQQPALAAEVDTMEAGRLPADWDRDLVSFPADAKGLATRESSGKVLNALAKHVPWLVGGAADLAPSTKTLLTFEGAGSFQAGSHAGRNFHFGIREHAMSAILNGLALSNLRPYGSGFLIFSDYARGAMRLSALMELPVTYVFTHDSIGVGEDGPTHQPVEQLPGLRAVPGMIVIRPGDANEVIEAWRFALQHRDGPVCLVLSRQAIPTLDRTKFAPASGLRRGGYVLADSPDAPEVILVGSGSEVSLCLAAHDVLAGKGVRSRVVSLPSWEIFAAQDAAYRDSVLPPGVRARVGVEMASSFGWERWVGLDGAVVGLHSFGASAPAKDVLAEFGFTTDAVVAAALAQAGRKA